MIISRESLQEIELLYEQNLNLQAYSLAKNHGRFSDWEGTAALLLGSHLAYSLGAPDASFRLTSRAWHKDRSDPRATFFYAAEMLSRRGPLPTLMFIRKHEDFVADDKLTSWWYSLRAQLHASLRDFSVASKWHERAFEVCPTESWVWVARSYSLEQQDRYEEALEAAMKGLELAPRRRATISAAAHYLTLLDRDAEAHALLKSSSERVENGWTLKELSDLQSELGMHRESYATLRSATDLMPMLEDEAAKWLYGGLSDSAYMKGHLDEAIEFAGKAGGEFFAKVIENMESAKSDARRVQLDVGFLRQHHVTCAPATLSNIARYWKKKADHLELVEEMCYDGTPSYKERAWAETNGWRTREFTLNRDNAAELLGRGVPMTLATVYPGGGHLQAIVGYDERRGTYLLRDPYYRRLGEVLAAELEEHQRANGPRVMALVPEGNAELLEGLTHELFESEVYDVLFALEGALDRHDREEAGRLQKEIEQKFPNHRLSLSARWAVANYDTNSAGVRSALHGLLELFPEDVNLRLNDVSVSSQFTSRSERLEKLNEYSKAKETDHLFWQMYGYELGLDARHHDRGIRWLYRSLRRGHGAALTYRFLADILWSKRRFEEATELYRFAVSLNDKDESLAYAYFQAMRHLKREDEALTVLAHRARLFIKQSGMPVRSFFNAQRELGMIGDAFATLDDAVAKRPTDGELYLFAADAKARAGRMEEAEILLRTAEKISAMSSWLRTSATVAHLKGDLDGSLARWRRVLETDPSAYDAHENIAFLLKGLEGAMAAKDHLRRVCRKFPKNRGLQTLRLEYLDEEAGEAIAVLRDLVRHDPSDVWCHRELSNWYRRVGKLERSLEAAESAVAAGPHDAASRWFRGQALEALGRYDEAIVEYETGVKNWADHAYSISSWLNLLRTKQEKLAALDVIWTEVKGHSITGDGLFAFRDESRRFLDGTDLLGRLREFQADNPRAWFAASAVVQQLVDVGDTTEALTAASRAVERFPLMHHTWLDLALVHKLNGNRDEEIAALQKVVAMNPTWSYGSQQLAEALERAGRYTEAKDVLTSALSRLPFDHYLHGYLAGVYWKLNDRNKAIETLRSAVAVEPGYEWAWRSIRDWANETGDAELPVKLARELTERKPRDARSWVNLAEMLESGAFSNERLDAIEQALKLDPHDPTALAMKANCLADARRYDEAIAVCRTVMPDGHHPEQLQFVEAGIEMNRGRVYRGIELMQALTRKSPGYLPGWARLADLYRNDPNRSGDYLDVARQLVRLSPREPIVYGYLAEAGMMCGNRDEAREALQQAVVLDPNYQFASDNLFSMLTEDGDVDGATQLAETLTHSAREIGLPMAIEVAAGANDREHVLDLIAEMLRSPVVIKDKADGAIDKATKLFTRRDTSLADVLRALCAETNINSLAGRYLITEVWRGRGRPACEEALGSVAENKPLWAEAAGRYLEILGAEMPDELVKFIDKNSDALAGHTDTWASVGYFLVNMDDRERMANWFAGWERRGDVKPWMLWNWSIVLRRDGLTAQADRVNRAAIDLTYDETVNLHLTSIGLAAFRSGNFDEARTVFYNINSLNMTDSDRFFYDLLADGLAAAESVASGSLDSAQSITDGIVTNVATHDPKQADQMVKDAVQGVLETILPMIGSRWYTFRVKARLYYYSLG
ncbi:MAG: tetratricopeptide repeat protein [Pyrinomonadaceae bacterium]